MKITKKFLGLILSDSMVEQKVTDDKNVSVLNHEYFNPSYQYRAITVLKQWINRIVKMIIIQNWTYIFLAAVKKRIWAATIFCTVEILKNRIFLVRTYSIALREITLKIWRIAVSFTSCVLIILINKKQTNTIKFVIFLNWSFSYRSIVTVLQQEIEGSHQKISDFSLSNMTSSPSL